MDLELDLTDDHLKLIYLISKFTRTAKNRFEKDRWIKEFPLRTLVFEGIISDIFDYDYAPMSVELLGGRRILNVSQDAEDDLADLREMGLIECLKLSSSNFRLTNAYKIRPKGMTVDIPNSFKDEIDGLCKCPRCGGLLEVEYDPSGKDDLIYIICRHPDCLFRTISGISEIEDVSYSTEPYFPVIPFFTKDGKHTGEKKFLQIKFREIIEARMQLFKEHYTIKLKASIPEKEEHEDDIHTE